MLVDVRSKLTTKGMTWVEEEGGRTRLRGPGGAVETWWRRFSKGPSLLSSRWIRQRKGSESPDQVLFLLSPLKHFPKRKQSRLTCRVKIGRVARAQAGERAEKMRGSSELSDAFVRVAVLV